MFNTGMNIPSLADIAAVTGNRNGNGWGDCGGAWWIIVILFALWGGFGCDGNGFGGFGGRGNGTRTASQADVQRGFDNQGVMNKLNGLENGLCDGFYAVNTSLLNGFNNTNTAMLQGFNGVNTALMQGNFGIQQAINADTVANMQNTNALQAQLSNCCCETRSGSHRSSTIWPPTPVPSRPPSPTRPSRSCRTTTPTTGPCMTRWWQTGWQTRTRLSPSSRTQVSQMTLAASQQAQNNYLVNQLRPPVNPAYLVQNPYAGTGTLPCQTGRTDRLLQHGGVKNSK